MAKQKSEGVTVIEWPTERDLRINNHGYKIERIQGIPDKDLRSMREAAIKEGIVDLLLAPSEQHLDPKRTLSTIDAIVAKATVFSGFSNFQRGAVMALACCEAFKTTSTVGMWERIWSLSGYSAELEFSMPEAMAVACAEEAFRSAFIKVAESVVKRAAENPGRGARKREADSATQLRANWKRDPSLSALYRSHFQHGFYAIGQDDDRILSIVANFDTSELVRLLALYDYPEPLVHAFTWGGVFTTFDNWKAVTLAAPLAFNTDCSWTGSLALPILLGNAREQFRFSLRPGSSPEEIARVSDEIRALATDVASVVAQRADALGCLARWGISLLRSAIGGGAPNPIDASFDGFVDDCLFEALGRAIATKESGLPMARDAEQWEPWCLFAGGVLLAAYGKIEMPAVQPWLDEWRIDPEGWPGDPGAKLASHANPFDIGRGRPDGYGPQILATAIVEHHQADVVWAEWWRSTEALREVIEFGDSDSPESNAWKGRSDAGELIMLQFGVGLTMMDQLTAPGRNIPYDRRKSIQKMLSHLFDGVRDLLAIDQFHQPFWNEALRHLAVRRSAWLSEGKAREEIALDDTAAPTLADFVRSLQGETEELLHLALASDTNKFPAGAIATAFLEAGVDWQKEVALARTLLQITPRSIRLNEGHMKRVSEIFRQPS